MVGAAIRENSRNFELFRHGSERDRIAGGDHAGKPVDPLRNLHSSELFYIAIDAGGFIRRNGHDLARAEKSALGIDLVGGKRVSFQRRSSQGGAGPRLKGHMTDLERRGGNIPFRFGDCSRRARRRDIRARPDCCCHAQAAHETAPIHSFVHITRSLRDFEGEACLAPTWNGVKHAWPVGGTGATPRRHRIPAAAHGPRLRT